MNTPIEITIDPASLSAFETKTRGRGLIVSQVATELFRQFCALPAEDITAITSSGVSFQAFEALITSRVRAKLGPELKIGEGIRDLMAAKSGQ